MIEIFSDVDWAADRQTRRSVSGATVFFGGCLIYVSSRTQKVVSLSGAESETYAAASATMDTILITTIFSWLLQLNLLMCLYLDSSAARGILARKGVGRLRHLSCRVLWLHDLVMEKRLLVRSVMGALNPADVATKRLSAARLESLCFLLGIWRGNNLEGAHDPGNIFRHVSTQRQHQGQSHYQVNLLISALSLLTQLQGCADAMELAEAKSNFGFMVVFTWLVGLMGYLYMALCQGHHQGSFDYMAAHVEPEVEPDNIDPMVIESDGLSESSEPIFSSAGLIHWLHR